MRLVVAFGGRAGAVLGMGSPERAAGEIGKAPFLDPEGGFKSICLLIIHYVQYLFGVVFLYLC